MFYLRRTIFFFSLYKIYFSNYKVYLKFTSVPRVFATANRAFCEIMSKVSDVSIRYNIDKYVWCSQSSFLNTLHARYLTAHTRFWWHFVYMVRAHAHVVVVVHTHKCNIEYRLAFCMPVIHRVSWSFRQIQMRRMTWQRIVNRFVDLKDWQSEKNIPRSPTARDALLNNTPTLSSLINLINTWCVFFSGV